MTNEFNQIVEGKNDALVIYEDEIALAFLAENASIPGEIVLFPKGDYNIMEMVPDDVMDHLSVLARKISDVCFELLSGQGTNVLIHNGAAAGQETDKFYIRILPRKKGDGIDFNWEAKQENDKELESVKGILESSTKNIFISAMKEKHKPIKKEEPKVIESEGDESDETDYRLDFLRDKY